MEICNGAHRHRFLILNSQFPNFRNRDLEDKNALVAKEVNFLQNVFEQEKAHRVMRNFKRSY